MISNSKNIIKILSIASVVITLVWLVISLGISGLPKNETFVYENGRIIIHSWNDIYNIITEVLFSILVVVNMGVMIICIRSKVKAKYKIFKLLILNFGVGVFFTLVILFGSIAVNGLWNEKEYNPQYYEFANNGQTIVIEEKSFLAMGESTIYQVRKDGVANIIGSFVTDDGGRNNGNYNIIWKDDYVEITYHTFQNADDLKTIRVELDL